MLVKTIIRFSNDSISTVLHKRYTLCDTDKETNNKMIETLYNKNNDV